MASKGSLLQAGRETGMRLAVRLLLLAVSAWSRLLVGILFIILLSWLLLSRVWQPLQQELVLPAGVVGEAPSFRIELWDSVRTARDERINHQSSNWQRYSQLFVARVVERR